MIATLGVLTAGVMSALFAMHVIMVQRPRLAVAHTASNRARRLTR